MERANTTAFIRGLWEEHPIFRQMLGMCPTMAITVTALNGFAMGAAVTFVLLFACTAASLLKAYIPHQVRIAVFIVVIATAVTLADIFLKALFPDISKSLGAFIPLIIGNCLILGRVELFALRNPLLPSILDAVGMGIGFMWGLTLIGGIRELLGTGHLFGLRILSEQIPACLMFILPPGGFLVFGCLVAALNSFQKKIAQKVQAS